MSARSNHNSFQPEEYPSREFLLAHSRLKRLALHSVEKVHDPQARVNLAREFLIENVGRNRLTANETYVTEVLLRTIRKWV